VRRRNWNRWTRGWAISLKIVVEARRKPARRRQPANLRAPASAPRSRLKRSTPMKRFHVHVAVDDLKRSIGFNSALFAAQPNVVKPDYAKWMLDDPRVNFAISTRGREPGLDHLGIQAESGEELKEIYARLHEAGGNIVEQGQTACCYAKSEKSWI